MRGRGAVAVVIFLLGAGCSGDGDGSATTTTTSAVAPCPAAGERITVEEDTTLDPTCTYGGIDVTGSDLDLDCDGAVVSGPEPEGVGVLVTTPVDVPQSDVTIHGCRVEGFLNGIRITRDGFRALAEGVEYDDAGTGVVVEDTTVSGTAGVGIFVDGYVQGTTIRDVSVDGAGSAGIYLEAGSRHGAVLDSVLEGNGFGENGDGDGSLFETGGTTFRYWGPGREGLSIDGSRDNVVRGTTFRGNSNGGIFLYKNCGELVDERPERWFERRDGAEGNLIEGNTFDGGRNGVWVGSRMGENVQPMDCSDPPYVDDAAVRILDRAAGTTIRDNTFTDVTYGIRVEDDDTTIDGNRFSGPDPGFHAVTIGTGPRTEVLGRPVRGTRLTGNASTIVGEPDPYRWAHGHEDTVDEGNTALGRPAPLCEGEPIPMPAIIFVEAVALQEPDAPPATRPEGGTPLLGPLPPCP